MADIPYMSQKHPGTGALISFGNALLHLGIIKEPWDQDGPEFRKLREDAGATAGPPTHLSDVYGRWYVGGLRSEEFNAVEIGFGTVSKLVASGMVVALPVWIEKIGLHSALLVGLSDGKFTVVNMNPFSSDPIVSQLPWDKLGYKRWNVPVVAYGRGAREQVSQAKVVEASVWDKISGGDIA